VGVFCCIKNLQYNKIGQSLVLKNDGPLTRSAAGAPAAILTAASAVLTAATLATTALLAAVLAAATILAAALLAAALLASAALASATLAAATGLPLAACLRFFSFVG
jgi:hypothetical protein